MKTGAKDVRACPWLDLVPSGRTLPVEHFVTARVNAVAKALNRSSARLYLSHFDMTVPEWRILSNMAVHGPCASRDLIEHISMDKALISRTIQRLKRRQFLVMSANPKDRRTSVIELTSAGTAMYRKLLPFARRRQSKLVRDLTNDERRVLWNALDKLQATAEKLNRLEAKVADAGLGRRERRKPRTARPAT